jgi:transmembrane sensor
MRLKYAAVAAALFVVVGLLPAVQTSLGLRSDSYATTIGEHRSIELEDGSHMVLDAMTRVRVRIDDDVREVDLLEGQAQFTVAKDVRRPFRVSAGSRTIVALGTEFNVEFTNDNVRLAMLEGRVAVVARDAMFERLSTLLHRNARASSTSGLDEAPTAAKPATLIEVSAGEELRIDGRGRSTFIAEGDLAGALAWRQGKVVFHDETLSEAARRINRYSRQHIDVDDPALRDMRVSGVFAANDATAFAVALQAYLPVTVDIEEDGGIRIRSR